MNLNEIYLFKYCKVGDLTKLKLLIDKESVNLNLRDKWDSTPLYYACLCGHLEIVEFLLDNGARCEANTFDGERCLYGALTDQIRNVLKNYKINTTKLDQYDLHLERLFEIGMHSDITFEIKERIFKAHKFILSARSDYFRAKFENKWRKRTWISGDNDQLVPEAFESILKFIYTGRFSTLKVHFRSCLLLAKMFKLSELMEKFQKELFNLRLIGDDVKLDDFDVRSDFDEEKVVHETDLFIIGKFGIHSKLNTSISILCQDKIVVDFKNLAFHCLPEYLKHFVPGAINPNLEQTVQITHDMKIILEESLNFCVHKAFVAERCDYFKAFLNDPFNELKSTDNGELMHMPTINLKEVSKEVLIEIIYFIYSDEFSRNELAENILLETLITADLYMLSSLKRKCAAHLANFLNNENIFYFLRLSRLYELKKLEFSCITHLANNLIELEKSRELREIIVEDAKNLKMRQETDSIDIIDDLRYAINESTIHYSHVKSKTNTNLEQRSKLGVIDKILSELNLIC